MLHFIVESPKRKLIVGLSVSVASLISFLIFFACFIYWRRRAEGKYSNDVLIILRPRKSLKDI